MFNILYSFILWSALWGFASLASAQTIPLKSLDDAGMKSLTGDFSASYAHTTISGASPLGNVFGFELGVVGGTTNTSHIQSLATQADPNANVNHLPDAALMGAVSVPLGFTGELSLLPKVGSQDFKFSTLGLALKWTPTQVFFDWPVNVAVRASYTKTTADFHATINSVASDLKFSDSQTALTLLVSKNFAVVEPYFGLGLVQATGDLSASGSSTVFNSSYTTSGEASVSRTGTQWLLGAELKLLVFKLGVEYSNMFSTSRVAGKLSFYF